MELDLNKYPWINPAVQAVSQLPQQQQPAVNLTQPAGYNVPTPQIQPQPQYQKTQNPSEYEQNAGYFSNINPNFLAGLNETAVPNRNALLNARNIFAAKKSWEDADRIESRLTEMLNDKNLTADQKNLLNLKLIDAQNVKKNSSDYANMLRNGGFNLYGLGAENTVGESAQALHNYQQRGMETLLNLPSYQERAFDKEMELAQSGMKPRDINFALEKYELPKIKREMANQYRDGVALYGMNPDGSLNEFGAEILSRMADVNPTSANAYSSLFANPKETFAADQTILQNIFNQDNANYRAGMQRDQNIWQSLFNAANTRQNLLTSLGYDYEKHQDNLKQRQYEFGEDNKFRWSQLGQKDRELRLKEYDSGIKNYIEYQKYLSNTPEGKFQHNLSIAQRLYGNDTDKITAFLEAQYHGGASGNQNYQKQEQVNKTYKNSLQLIRNALTSGDKVKAKELITRLNTDLGDTSSIYIGTWNDADFDKATMTLALLNDVADDKIGFAEADKRIFDLTAIPTPRVGTGDSYMAEAMNSGRLKGLIDEALKNHKSSDTGGGFLDFLRDNTKTYEEILRKYPNLYNVSQGVMNR